jgi:hypothetical protein
MKLLFFVATICTSGTLLFCAPCFSEVRFGSRANPSAGAFPSLSPSPQASVHETPNGLEKKIQILCARDFNEDGEIDSSSSEEVSFQDAELCQTAEGIVLGMGESELEILHTNTLSSKTHQLEILNAIPVRKKLGVPHGYVPQDYIDKGKR